MESSVKPADSSATQSQAESAPQTQDAEALRERIVDTLRSIYDPEIPVNIYEIGLIYSVDIDPANAVNIRMTLTSPACPAAGTFLERSRTRLAGSKVSLTSKLIWSGIPPGRRQ